MSFGLQGVPSTFRRMMDNLLRGMERLTLAYMDDIAVYTCS